MRKKKTLADSDRADRGSLFDQPSTSQIGEEPKGEQCGTNAVRRFPLVLPIILDTLNRETVTATVSVRDYLSGEFQYLIVLWRVSEGSS